MQLLDNWIRISLYGLLLLVMLSAATFLYMARWSPQARTGNRNAALARQIKVGMTKQQALTIMGKPKKAYYSRAAKQGCCYYTASPLASGDISFCFNSADKVTLVGVED
jgi:hypothetical protein